MPESKITTLTSLRSLPLQRKRTLKYETMTTEIWRHAFCLLCQFPRYGIKNNHSLPHQKFRFFTFSRDDALALDRICCSDNVDMLYFN